MRGDLPPFRGYDADSLGSSSGCHLRLGHPPRYRPSEPEDARDRGQRWQGQKTLKMTIQNRSQKALQAYPIGHATMYFELIEGKRSNLQVNPLVVSNQMKVLKPSEHLVGHLDLTYLSQRLAKGKHRIRLRYGDSYVNGVYASHKWTGRSSIGTVLGPELSITITSTSAVHVHQVHCVSWEVLARHRTGHPRKPSSSIASSRAVTRALSSWRCSRLSSECPEPSKSISLCCRACRSHSRSASICRSAPSRVSE